MQDIKPKEFIAKHHKEWTLVAITIISTVLLIVGFHFLPNVTSRINSADVSVPEEFLGARIRAGDAANRLSELTDTYVESIEKISEEEKSGDFSKGLDLILEEVDKNEEVRQAAE